MRSPIRRAFSGAVLGFFHAAGRLLPGDTAAGRLARRLFVRFAPAPEPPPPPPDEDELDHMAALAFPDPHRVRVAVRQLLQDPEATLTFPAEPSPAVSVVVVTRDAVHGAYRCLESVLAHGGAGYELVVADAGSRDRTRDLVSRLRNATCLPLDATGVIDARNGAARHARGRHLLLLDQHVALGPASLSALVEAIEADVSCGAAGGALVRPDGRLEQAGGVIWSDGAVQAYGAGEDALEPATSYAREVDFCSSAFLLVRRDLFDRLGSVDEGFAPGGLYDSADLCMGIRRLGSRVHFVPGAFGFVSENGVPADPAAESAERARFVQKWAVELERQPDRGTVPLVAARDRAPGPRVLVIEDRVPAATRGAGYPRSWAMLEMLASLGYRVTLYPYHDRTAYQPWVYRLQRAGIEVMIGKGELAELATARSGLYDALIVSRPPNFQAVAPLLGPLFPGAGVVYDAEALWFQREKLKAAVESMPWADAANEEAELALLRKADVVVTVSGYESRLVVAAVPSLEGRVHVWGHPVTPRPTPLAFADRRDLLFVGGFQLSPSPNEDAVGHFVREVLPAVRTEIDCTLRIVGFRAPEALAAWASDAVRLAGGVDDLTPWYDACRVFVVPHRYSAGIPLKLCEAMARGIPAVVSSLTAEQLGVEGGREVLVGRTPQEFAGRIVELYRDQALWERLRENGLAFVRRHNDPDTLRSKLDAIVKAAMAAARRKTVRPPASR